MTEYYFYYILSLFNQDKKVSTSQLFNVIQGKRTPSMFYLTEINQWHHIFETDKYLVKEDLNRVIHLLVKRHYLKAVEDGYLLTTAGQEAFVTYFSEHYYPQRINSFANINVRVPFWDRIQLYSQVFSEISYQNAQYTPVIKHPHHQENVRLFFQAFSKNKEKLLESWVAEQRFIYSELQSKDAAVIIKQLSSHDYVGKTKSQLANDLNMTPEAFDYYFDDVLEVYIGIVENNKKSLALTYSILNQMHRETLYGLSMSTFQTYQLLKEGHSIIQIAHQRHLKENTVREHILEIAFVLSDFPYSKFIPTHIYKLINQKFETEGELLYRDLVKEYEEIEFMHFRLVELERMRKV